MYLAPPGILSLLQLVGDVSSSAPEMSGKKFSVSFEGKLSGKKALAADFPPVWIPSQRFRRSVGCVNFRPLPHFCTHFVSLRDSRTTGTEPHRNYSSKSATYDLETWAVPFWRSARELCCGKLRGHAAETSVACKAARSLLSLRMLCKYQFSAERIVVGFFPRANIEPQCIGVRAALYTAEPPSPAE